MLCEVCGKKRGDIKTPSGVITCDDCQNLVDEEGNFLCPKCGHKMEWEQSIQAYVCRPMNDETGCGNIVHYK